MCNRSSSSTLLSTKAWYYKHTIGCFFHSLYLYIVINAISQVVLQHSSLCHFSPHTTSSSSIKLGSLININWLWTDVCRSRLLAPQHESASGLDRPVAAISNASEKVYYRHNSKGFNDCVLSLPGVRGSPLNRRYSPFSRNIEHKST